MCSGIRNDGVAESVIELLRVRGQLIGLNELSELVLVLLLLGFGQSLVVAELACQNREGESRSFPFLGCALDVAFELVD